MRPMASHHPRMGKTLGSQRFQAARRLRRSKTKIFSRSSGPWEICLGPDAGRDAVQAGNGLFSLYLPRHGFQICTVRATELSRSPVEFVATPLQQCVLPSQLWGSNWCIMGSSPITVASAWLMGLGGLNLPYHNCIPKYQFVQLLKMTFRLSYN